MIISGSNIVTEEKEPNKFKKPIIIGIVSLSVLCIIMVVLIVLLQVTTQEISIDGRIITPRRGFIYNG